MLASATKLGTSLPRFYFRPGCCHHFLCLPLFVDEGLASFGRSFLDQLDSINRHKVSIEEVQNVLASDISFYEDLEPSERGHNRVMMIGWTEYGRILEIGIEFFPDYDHIFHAKDAGKSYVQAFEKRLRSWQL
jgi:hypothetical protein